MAMGRPKTALVLDAEQREQLESLATSRSLPAGLVRRAKIILLSASGKTNLEIAGQLKTTKVTVGLWRRRFLKHGMSGLYEELRPGHPRPISDERVALLEVNAALAPAADCGRMTGHSELITEQVITSGLPTTRPESLLSHPRTPFLDS